MLYIAKSVDEKLKILELVCKQQPVGLGGIPVLYRLDAYGI